jgi:hypothetical protein
MVEAVGIKNYHIEVPLNDITSLQNLIKMYQVVQKVSIDPLYLMPAISLGCFCTAVNNWLSFHGNIIAFYIVFSTANYVP